MRKAWIVAVWFACAPTRPAPVVVEEPPSRPVLAMPPAVETRPPPPLPAILDAPPISLEPHFPIADAFGTQTWMDACESRGRLRIRGDVDELLTYLAAWCNNDRTTVLDQVFPLAAATTPHLADAARADLIALAADRLTGPDAVAYLARVHVSPLPLAEAYEALGKPDDAIAVLGLVQLPDTATSDERCRYYGRLAIEGPAKVRGAAAREVPADCTPVRDYLQCPLATGKRSLVWQNIEELRAQVGYEIGGCPSMDDAAYLALHDRWPQASRAPGTWNDYITVIEQLDWRRMPNSIAELAVLADENLARVTSCDDLTEVIAHASAIGKLALGPGDDLAARLSALEHMTTASCRALNR